MKSLIASVATIAIALFLPSCTSPAGTSGDGHSDHDHGAATSAPGGQPAANNAADLAFVTGMIPHHEQAVEMSGLVPDRSTNPEVVKLAADIAGAQGPEIATMKAFLAQWNADSDPDADPKTGHEDHEGMNGMGMQGMVDDGTMARLQSLRGAEFDQLWLQSMIGHHEGAVSMAKTEIADGANVDAKTLATQIVSVQQAEIGQMKQMLGG